MRTCLRRLIIFVFPLVFSHCVYAQWISITSSHIENSSGSSGLLASGTLCAQPVDSNNHPLAVRAGGGGIITAIPACTTVTNGAISGFQLPDTSVTQPVNACFRITIKDTNGIPQLPAAGYQCVQPSSIDGAGTTANAWCTTTGGSTTCDLDNYPTLSPVVNLTSTGPIGLTGPPATFLGAWSGSTAYSLYQAVSYGGNSFVALTANTGVTPPSSCTSSATWGSLACAGTNGSNGANGTNGISSLAQLASVRVALPGVINLFNSAAVTTGDYVNGTTGALVANSGYAASAYIPTNSGATMTTSSPISNGTVGYAFYDQSNTYLSGSNTTTAACAVITAPSTAAFVRVSVTLANVNYEMLVNGSTCPTSYASFTAMDTFNSAYNAAVATNTALTAHVTSQNLFNSATATVGATKTLNGTIDTTITSDSSSALMSVAGYATVVSNVNLTVSGGYGPAWFDIYGNFLSAFSSSVTAGTTITVPQYAAFLRVYWGTSSNATAMVVNGSTLPSSYAPYNRDNATAVNIATGAASFLNDYQLTRFGHYVNLYNYQSPTLTVGALRNTGTIDTTITGDVVSDFMPVSGLSSIVTIPGLACSGGYCADWFDAYGNFLSQVGSTTSGQVVTVPTGAASIRIYSPAYPGNFMWTTPQMIIAGGTAPTSYVPFSDSASAYLQQINNCVMGFFGDSITATYGWWTDDVLIRTGCSLGFRDAVNSRGTINALSNALGGSNGHYTGNTATSTNNGSGTAGGTNTGTSGNTLTQDLANLTTLVIFEGTDDCPVSNSTLGSSASTAWDGSEYGNIKGLLETLQTANPSMRIVWVGPYYQAATPCTDGPTLPNIRAAIAYETQQHGVPFLDLEATSGVNPQSVGVDLQSDTIHPLQAWAHYRLGPQIGNFIKGLL